MQTEVIMRRELLGFEIAQKSKTELFSATDLVRAGNKWRKDNGLPEFNMSQWLRLKSTQEFISEVENQFGSAKMIGRGRSAHTWVHPLIFIDMALAIHPKLKVEVYKWLHDKLLKFRNDSGDSYKEACAALYIRYQNHQDFPKWIKKVANYIREVCGVEDWQKATVEQLEKRDKIQLAIKLYAKVLTNPREIIRLAVAEIVGNT